MTSTATTPLLATLVDDLDVAVHGTAPGRPLVDAVGDALRPYLGRTDLLRAGACEPDTEHYRQHVLHVAPDKSFSLVALVWLPGQETPIHDHLAWCVVGVHQGGEYETRYQLTPDGDALAETIQAHAAVGDVAGLLPPGDIHKVRNDGADLAISLHVYGADIGSCGSSVRRLYENRVLPTA